MSSQNPSQGQWEYQIRVNLADAFAAAAKANPVDAALKPLTDVLAKYSATMKNQFDAFADFCKDAEARNDTDTDMYRWTKATVDTPGKEQQYATRFTIYADGGREVHSKTIADALEADLQPLMGTLLTKISKIESDPAKNPQAPAKYRR
jgi:hypothetical protein